MFYPVSLCSSAYFLHWLHVHLFPIRITKHFTPCNTININIASKGTGCQNSIYQRRFINPCNTRGKSDFIIMVCRGSSVNWLCTKLRAGELWNSDSSHIGLDYFTVLHSCHINYSYALDTELFPRGQSGRRVTLKTHLNENCALVVY